MSRVLTQAIAEQVADSVREASPGHCVRIDDVDADIVNELLEDIRALLPTARVHVLRAAGRTDAEIPPERAIEIRNRKIGVFVLLVPAGEGYAASSLDNSFQRLAVSDLFKRAERSLLARVEDREVQSLLHSHRRLLRGQRYEAWASFLATLVDRPSIATFGQALWLVGLVPDHGEDPASRLLANAHAVRQLSRPSRPSSTIDDRLTDSGMREGTWRAPLRYFLEQQGSRLANPVAWCREIAENHRSLTFDKWQRTETPEDDLEDFTIDRFLKPDGSVDSKSKLSLGGDGQLVLRVPDEGTADVRVRWTTDPPVVTSVAGWQLDVVLPEDMRSEEQDPLGSVRVRGSQRTALVKVAADADQLAHGSRFVVRVRAIGDSGEALRFLDGGAAERDSEEFQVLTQEAPEAAARRVSVDSLPAALVREAVSGVDDLHEDMVTWDLDGQVFGVRVGRRRAIQVRVSPLLVQTQRFLTHNHTTGWRFQGQGQHGTLIAYEELTPVELSLPGALAKARSELFGTLGQRGPRDTAESAVWDEELLAGARSYLSKYRRAIESAPAEGLADLLMLDSIGVRLRRKNRWIEAVILLPLHPLRLAWIAEYDSLLRSWADAATRVTPKGARRAMLDTSLTDQLQPANLPFVVPTPDGSLAHYCEELTYGTGLYIVPTDVDRDEAAATICSVLGLSRDSSARSTAAGLVGERIAAYVNSHRPSGTVRMRVLNPADGSLCAGAIQSWLAPQLATDDADEDPPLLEVNCYTDSPDYVHPVPALTDLQERQRRRELVGPTSHLFPPLALSVSSLATFAADPRQAHIALLQDISRPSVTTALPSERAPALDGLLVPLIPRWEALDDQVIWQFAPAMAARLKNEYELTAAHRAHQLAVSRHQGGEPDTCPVVEIPLTRESRRLIEDAHEAADWVIAIDRYLGMDVAEATEALGRRERYILDYAPDFVDGIGDRLTVTTGRRWEVESILGYAMEELGLARVNNAVHEVLQTLNLISGRLALRLVRDSSQAREAVALAAVVTHLRKRGHLEDTIVIPVDAHPEVFGPLARGQGSARRCDMLLVRLGARSFKIECVEVKSRQASRLPESLVNDIVDQLTDTRELLMSLYFVAEDERIDRDLQRARLVSLLHFYADRAHVARLITRERLDEVHRFIDRIGDTGEFAEISMTGYVISLDGQGAFKKKQGDVSIRVITADELGEAGFTTHDSAQLVKLPGGSEPDSGGTSDPPVLEGGQRSASDPRDRGDDVATPREPEGEDSPGRPGSSTQPDSGDREGAESAEPSAAGGGESVAERSVRESVGIDVALGHDSGAMDVQWHVSTKGSPHAFIVGIPGQGKSVTTRRIIREFAEQGLPSLIIDFHGDMARNPPPGAQVLDAASGLPFSPFEVSPDAKLSPQLWEIAEVIAYVAGMGEIQRTHVYKALLASFEHCGWVNDTPGERLPTMSEFAEAIEEVESGARGQNARSRLLPLTDFGLFSETPDQAFKMLDADHGIVVDLSRLNLEEVQRAGASFLMRKVYREMFTWPQDRRMKLAVVLDEAHRVARDVTLPKLMKEGRKYGLSVIVASQNVTDFHRDVLANAGVKVIFRTNYPDSKSVGGFLRSARGVDLGQAIERLDVGQAYVSTPGTPARKVYMHE